MQLQVFQSFALDKIEVVSLPESPVLKSSTKAFQIAVVNVEKMADHVACKCSQMVRNKMYFQEKYGHRRYPLYLVICTLTTAAVLGSSAVM